MITPSRLLVLIRLAFASGAGLAAVLMFGPYQGLERSFGLNDTAAHAIAFYLGALALFAIAPSRRRDDLVLFAVAAALAVEVLQPLTGRSMSISDFLAGFAGVAAAYLPSRVEEFRQVARRAPHLSLTEIRSRDRRRRMASTTRATPPATREAQEQG